MGTLFMNPPPTHIIYIPAVLMLGIVIGFVIGRRSGIKEGQNRSLGGEGLGEDDDLI
jgi:hypothetical protein